MSCNTWFFKKIETPSEEHVINSLNAHKSKLQKIIAEHPLDDTFGENDLSFWITEFMSLKDLIDTFDYGDVNSWGEIYVATLMNVNDTNNITLIEYFEDKGFYQELGAPFYNIFTITHAYNNDILYSLSETLEYIKNHNCKINDSTNDRLKLFWETYPDGIIEFG